MQIAFLIRKETFLAAMPSRARDYKTERKGFFFSFPCCCVVSAVELDDSVGVLVLGAHLAEDLAEGAEGAAGEEDDALLLAVVEEVVE